jgi:hypothetical protein
MSAEEIARVLHGRRSGRGYMAPCPAHDDRSPSLSITERGGRILVHCHAGCPQAHIIAALRARGLWPERERPEWTPADRARWARERAEAERIRGEAAYFADVAALMAEWALDELAPGDPERAIHTCLVMALRVSPEAEYRAWVARDPKWAATLVHAGRERDRRLQVALAHWIVAGMPGVADAA